MSQIRHPAEGSVLVRFWSLDHHRAEPILWTPNSWSKLIYAVEGTVIVHTPTQYLLLPRHRALLLPGDSQHSARTAGRAKVRTLFFAQPLADSSRPLSVRPLFHELIHEACRVGPLLSSHPEHVALARLLEAEIPRAPTLASEIPMPTTPWAKSWGESYLMNPGEAPPVPCSLRTQERVFLKETGLTLGRWCQQARALAGLRALSEGATVLEAAMAAGFATSSGFIQAFQKQFGITPGRAISQTEVTSP